MCIVGMFQCYCRSWWSGGDGGLADLWRKEAGREVEVGQGSGRPPGLDRFQWNRLIGWSQGTCNGTGSKG